MSELRVDNIVDMGGSGAPQLRKGASVTGISTITQAVVGNATINAGGINATGIVTSSSNKFVGDFASGNITAGVMTATSSVVGSNITINSGGVNASGIVSATSYTGSGANLTGIGLSIAPIIYKPTVGETGLGQTPTIELSVNQRIKVGVGSISLRMVGAGSTVIETFGLGISTSATYTVTVASSKFYLDGNLSYSPTLYPGGVYTFDQSAGTNATHPLRFATAADAAGSTEYTTGVETNGTPGSAGAYTRITVAADAPTPLYYYCSNHSNMGSTVTIGKNVSIDNDGTLPKLSFTPSSNIGLDSQVFVDIPTGSITKMDGTSISPTNWTFSIRSPYSLYVFGDNELSQLGQNQSYTALKGLSSPTQIPGTWNDIVVGNGWMQGIRSNGTLWGWGDNRKGQLGQNSINQPTNHHQSSPVQIPGTTWSSFPNNFSGSNPSWAAATKTDGTLWVWGSQTYNGQLAQNNRTEYSSPVQVPGTWDKIATGDNNMALIKDGELYMVGRNDTGILGQNDRTYRSSPVQVPGTTWANVDLGDYGGATFAVRTDGTLWSWGYNAANGYGILGHNDLAHRSSPTQVGTETTWSTEDNKISVGYRTITAIKTDGTMWSWGGNQYGSIGNGQAYPGPQGYSSPVQVPGTTWSAVHRSGYSAYAMKTDGTAWGFGREDHGQLGNNSITAGQNGYSSPIQIPGTNWAAIGIRGGGINAAGFKA